MRILISLLCAIMFFFSCTKKTIKTPDIYPDPIPKVETTVQANKKAQKAGTAIMTPYASPKVEPVFMTVYFAFNSSKIPTQELLKIDLLNVYGKKVKLTGGACPIGSNEYNIGLGLDRASSVGLYLKERGAEIIELNSVGEEILITENTKEYWKNRRCEVEVLK